MIQNPDSDPFEIFDSKTMSTYLEEKKGKVEGIKIRLLPGVPKLSFAQLGSGDLVIFIHGGGGNKENWYSNMESLSKEFNVVALDLRGYGESEDFEGPLNFSDVADDIHRLTEYLGYKKCHIVGLSFGAMIALYFYERYPELSKSLVLCDAPLGKGFSESEREKFIRLRKKPIEDGIDLNTMAINIADTLIGNKFNKFAYTQLVNSIEKIHRESYLKALESSVKSTHYNIYSKVSIPVLVLVGELDKLTPVSTAEKIRNSIAGSILEVIPDAGHVSNIENPTEFDKVLLNFLRSM